MSELDNDKESMICFTWKPSQSFFLLRIKSNEIFLPRAFYGKGGEDWTINVKEGFWTALTTAIKKDPKTSKRKHGNELKGIKKTVRTAIKQDLSPDVNPLY